MAGAQPAAAIRTNVQGRGLTLTAPPETAGLFVPAGIALDAAVLQQPP